MILLACSGYPLERALEKGLTREGHAVRTPFTSTSLELIVTALACRAVVYAAGDSMLGGHLAPRPSASRARQILLASAVPGVQLVVGIVPTGEAYLEEERLLQTAEVPAIVLRCAPLIEELSGAARSFERPRDLRVTTGELLASTVNRALGDEAWRGRVIEVPTILLSPSWAAPRAARRSSAGESAGLPAFA